MSKDILNRMYQRASRKINKHLFSHRQYLRKKLETYLSIADLLRSISTRFSFNFKIGSQDALSHNQNLKPLLKIPIFPTVYRFSLSFRIIYIIRSFLTCAWSWRLSRERCARSRSGDNTWKRTSANSACLMPRPSWYNEDSTLYIVYR